MFDDSNSEFGLELPDLEPISRYGLTAAQHKARSKGIGGSDAAAVIGISKWKTPVQLWQEKSGLVPREDKSDVEFIQWGNILEDVIAQEWARREGVKIRRSKKTHVDKEYPFMVGDVDRLIVGKREGLECKNASFFVLKEFGDGSAEIPMYYAIQGVHYMRILDYDAWNYAVLIGGNNLRHYRIERNYETEAMLIDLERDFWEHVEDGTAPAPINLQDLVRLYPNAQGRIKANKAVVEIIDRLRGLQEQRKLIVKEEESLKFDIGAFMGEHSELISASDSLKTLVTYRPQKVNRIQVKQLRADSPEIAALYTEETTERKMLVKKK